jgi:hypothetical protein
VRELADRRRIVAFMEALGRETRTPARVYLTGGATAVLLGWRETTIDVDIKIVPDQDALLRAVPALKEALQLNVELASPDDFIPVRDDWQDRSPFIVQEASLSFHHFDPTAQALAKIERGHAQDRDDVSAMLDRGLVTKEGLRAYYDTVEPRLYRYPALDPASFRRAVLAVTGA